MRLPFLFLILISLFSCQKKTSSAEEFVVFEVKPARARISMHWKDDSGQPLKSLGNLKKYVEAKGENLIFAANGGMFENDNIPKGLYIENFKIFRKTDHSEGKGNFYLPVNGIFYILKNGSAHICETSKFRIDAQPKFATQSGPMLVLEGIINDQFKKSSTNLQIRNGVGIRHNGDVVFAMSKNPVSFYDFADFFKKTGCVNALYLDGFVSRTYLPQEKILQTHGNFGIMIAVTEKNLKNEDIIRKKK